MINTTNRNGIRRLKDKKKEEKKKKGKEKKSERKRWQKKKEVESDFLEILEVYFFLSFYFFFLF